MRWATLLLDHDEEAGNGNVEYTWVQTVSGRCAIWGPVAKPLLGYEVGCTKGDGGCR